MNATPAPAAPALSASRVHRFGLLASLYVSQAIPLGFFVEAVPAIGRDMGLSLRAIGMIQVLALPYMIKFLWAPVVDAYGNPRGHYRSWLLPLQSVAVLAVLLMAATDPGAHTGRLMTLAAIFLFVAATQDIATDALAVRLLPASERGSGNGIQVGGYYLGQMLGGGLMLVLLERFGWGVSIGTMAVAMAVPVLLLIGFREPAGPVAPSGRIDFGALRRFFGRAGNARWAAILLLYRMGDAMAITMAKPMLVDLGWSLSQIGVLIGVGTSLGALGGALVGGQLIGRLGRRTSLIGFEGLHAVALLGCAFAVSSLGSGRSELLAACLVLVAFAGGMATAALYTWMMDRTQSRSAGTDFTLQQALAAMGPLVAAGLSGVSANALGYPVHFVVCAALSAAVAVGVTLSSLASTAEG